MITNDLLESNSLPKEVRKFLTIATNTLSGLKDLNCAKLFPKLGPTHPNGDPKYLGMLIGCMDPDGNYHFTQAGELADRSMSEKILLNKLNAVHGSNIKKSMEVRDPSNLMFSGAVRGAGKFSGWIFGITGWPETVDDNVVEMTIYLAEIVSLNDYGAHNKPNQTGLSEALVFTGIKPAQYIKIAYDLYDICEESWTRTLP